MTISDRRTVKRPPVTLSRRHAAPAAVRWVAVHLQPLILLMLILIARPATAAPAGDDAVRQAVERLIAEQTALSAGAVTVAVDDGIVRLSGTAGNLLQRERVQRIAEGVRGVRSVIDTIRVVPAVRDDAAIAGDVRRALDRMLPDRADAITVAVDGGAVTLGGSANAWTVSRTAVRAAMTVRGVSAVRDAIAVKSVLSRPDRQITDDIRRRLAADPYIDAGAVTIEVTAGRVRLGGRVGSVAEKRRTTESAWITGVVAVDAHRLSVDPSLADPMRRHSPMVPRPDKAVLASVREALRMDNRVNAFNPEVTVKDGRVTLTGVVDTLYARRAAQADAENTAGVWHVDNQLQLRYRALPGDAEVKRMIEDVFQRDAELHAADIDVAVAAHHVTLSGRVAVMGQKVRAENIASQIDGVLTLANRITVGRRTAPVSDAELTTAIVDRLLWSPYVAGSRISVSVADQTARLQGAAANRFAARLAVRSAFDAGAATVHAELTLDDGGTVQKTFSEAPSPGPIFGAAP